MIVENINLFSSQSKSFGDFVRTYSDEGVYIPNEFQRDYGWTKSQIEQLLEDILEAFEQNKFLMINRIAVSRMGGKEFIIDGQQRITTLFIIYSRLYFKTNPEGRETFLIRDLFDSQKEDRPILENSLESHPNSSVFRDIIVRGIVGDKSNLLNNCAMVIDRFVNNLDLNKKELELLLRYIDKRVYFGVDFLPEEYSVSYYDDINSKGLKLDSVDKVKTYLGSLVGNYRVFSELWIDFLNVIDKLKEVGFRTRTSSTLQEFVIDCALKTFEGVGNNGQKIGKQFSSKPISEIETFIRKEICTSDMAKSLIEHSIYVGERMTYYFSDCEENTVFNNFGKNTSAHITSFILSDMKGVKLETTASIIERIWMVHTNSGGGKKKSERSVKPINRILLNGGTETDVVSWFKNEVDSTLKHMFDLKRMMEEVSYETPSGRRVIRTLLVYAEAYLRSNYYKTPFHKEFQDLTSRRGNNSITLEHIVPQKDGVEKSNCIGNITILSRTDNSRLKDSKERKFNVYSNSEFLLNKVMLQTEDAFNNSFNMSHVIPHFIKFNDEQLSDFESFIETRENNLLGYIEKEILKNVK